MGLRHALALVRFLRFFRFRVTHANAAPFSWFVLWRGVWQSIVGVIQHLRARSQTAKLALYVHFRRVLVGSFAFAVAWVIFSVVRSSEMEEVSERVLLEVCHPPSPRRVLDEAGVVCGVSTVKEGRFALRCCCRRRRCGDHFSRLVTVLQCQCRANLSGNILLRYAVSSAVLACGWGGCFLQMAMA